MHASRSAYVSNVVDEVAGVGVESACLAAHRGHDIRVAVTDMSNVVVGVQIPQPFGYLSATRRSHWRPEAVRHKSAASPPAGSVG